MFRVVGRDARGASVELSVYAATGEEARAIVLGSGHMVAVDRVTVPLPSPPRRLPRISGWVVTVLGCLLCLGFTTVA